MIGNLIYTLRTQQEIPQKKLCYGLCSDATLSRIELEERVPDRFLVDAVIQRLGKSPDKFFSVLSERDYILLCIREKIERAIENDEWQTVEEVLDYYLTVKEAKGGLHRQYCMKIQSILSYHKTKDPVKGEMLILSAIKQTIPDFEINNIKDYYLCREEIILILMLIICLKAQKRTDEYRVILQELLEYIDEHYTDEEEKVKIYPKAALFQAEYFLEQKKYKEAGDTCLKAIELLADNAVIFGMSGLLNIYLESREKDGQIVSQKYKKQMESLIWVYEKYEIPIVEEDDVIKCNSQTEVFLMNEIIKSSRKNNGISQEMLGGDILSPETISRIESGKRKPHINNFKKIKKALGIDKDIYNVYILAYDFTVYEKKREIERLAAYHQYEEIRDRFEELKKLIDMDDKMNVQYILMTQTWLDQKENKISSEKAVKKLNDILDLTIKRQNGIKIENLSLSKQEANIINRMAILYNKMNQDEKAINLLEAVLLSYKNSQIDMKYHSVSALMIMSNLEKFLEESDKLDEAIEICDQAIKLTLRCGRGQFLGKYLAKKGFVLERVKEEHPEKVSLLTCSDYFQKAYYISCLMKDKVSADIIKKYIMNKYQDVLLYD